jgi:hypothetical protein
MFTEMLLGRLVLVDTSGRIDCGLRSRRLAGMRIVVMSGRHSAHESRGASRSLCTKNGVPGDVLLTGATTGPLPRHNRTPLEDLATPHTPRLGALYGAGQALDPYRAVDAQRLGELKLSRRVGEPQVGVERPAGEVGLDGARRSTHTVHTYLDCHVEGCRRQAHSGHLSFSFGGLDYSW